MGSLVERRILRFWEGLLHQLRVWLAQYRVDDPGIEVCPLWGWGNASPGVISVSGIFNAPAEKALHDRRRFREGEVQKRKEGKKYRDD